MAHFFIPTETKNKLFLKKLDISKPSNIKKFIEKNSKILKKVSCINLAAISVDKLIPNLKEADINRVYKINTFSNIYFTKYLLKNMIKDNYGRFIHFTSTRAIKGDIGISLYASSKSSLISFSKCIAKEFGRFNITSNTISLGYFNSPLLNNIQEDIKKKMINDVPSKKIGNVQNISNAIITLIKSDYISAADIKIDGGI